jgi:transcription initiation factor TFIIIB Brf1 subunit/transcription initiation factor TFIIB
MKEINFPRVDTVCPECKHTHIITDPFHQETYCTRCGLVLQSPIIFKITEIIEAEENKNRTLNMFWKETNRQIKLKKIRDIYKVSK